MKYVISVMGESVALRCDAVVFMKDGKKKIYIILFLVFLVIALICAVCLMLREYNPNCGEILC